MRRRTRPSSPSLVRRGAARRAGARPRRRRATPPARGRRSARANRRSKSSRPATAPARPATRSWSRSRSRTSSSRRAHFGGEPQLGEGHLRFSLNRVPDCVDPEKLQTGRSNSPLGNGRLVGASFDYPALRRAQRRPRRADRLRRQLLARDPAGDLLPRPPARLLPPGRHPRPEQRRDHALPRRHQLPDPAAARPRPETLHRRQSLQRQGRRASNSRAEVAANTSLCIVGAMRTYRRLMGFLRPYRPQLWGSLVFAWAAMGMTVLIPWLIGRAVNAIEDGDKPDLLPLALAIVGAGDPAAGADRGAPRWSPARSRWRSSSTCASASTRTCSGSSSASSTASRPAS